MGKNIGFSVADIDSMTPAMILDAAIYEINSQDSSSTEQERKATQADYDSF